jgi:hypothetical protein
MNHLAKIFLTASMATLLGLSSTADAKGSKKHKGKRAQASKTVAQESAAADSVPWYEQGLEDLTPASTVKPKVIQVKTSANVAPSFERLGQKQTRRTQAPSGLCSVGCDKSARNISMATLVLVKDSKAAKKKKSAATRSKTTKSSKLAKLSPAKKIASKK